jgi:hypothetical protein
VNDTSKAPVALGRVGALVSVAKSGERMLEKGKSRQGKADAGNEGDERLTNTVPQAVSAARRDKAIEWSLITFLRIAGPDGSHGGFSL